MKALKQILKHISLKGILLGSFILISLFITGILTLVENHMMRSLADQQMAARWSSKKDAAQISAFFAEGEVENSSYFKGIGVAVDQALVSASLTAKEKETQGDEEGRDEADEAGNNPVGEEVDSKGRLWMDAISLRGKASLVSGKATVETDVIGVEGDFFQFHPLYLVSGTFFSTDNPMKDGVIIDRETAWQLFGSSDVAGMEVSISGVPHIIIGVYEKAKGRLQEAAGLDKTLCFMSIDSLNNYGTPLGGYSYDIVLPNPIKNFGLATMRNALGADNANVKIVDNSTRYHIVSLLNVIKNFGIRSMSEDDIIYPYWENIARGYEDYFAVSFLLKAILAAISSVLILIIMVSWYKNKRWSIGSLGSYIGDKVYEMQSNRMIKKKQDVNRAKDAIAEEENEAEEIKETKEVDKAEEIKETKEVDKAEEVKETMGNKMRRNRENINKKKPR